MKPYNFVIKRTFIYPVQIEAKTKKEAIEIAEKLKIPREKWQDQGTEIESEKEFRTDQQNKGMHKFFAIISEILNSKGHTLTILAKIGFNLSFTPTIIKENVWKPLQKALFGTDSTTRLHKDNEIKEIVDSANEALAEYLECYVPFPSREILHYEKIAQQYKENE